MWDVFISYAHSDGTPAAVSAKTALEGANLNVWMDDRIHGGDRFRGAIDEALEQAQCVVVLWSAAATESPFVEGESGQAARRGTLLPCFLEKGIEEKVPIEQRPINGLPLYLEARDFTPSQLATLVAEVKRKLSEPRSEPRIAEVVRDLREKLTERLKDRYTLVNQLGHGGSSVVFRARSAQNQRAEFAIKVTTVHVLLLNDGLYDSFLSASTAAAQLRHPNIVNVHNFERTDDLFLSVTNLVDGQSLKSTLKAGGPLPLTSVQSILSKVAGALAYAYSVNVPHLALSPGKIIIDRTGNAFVTDFGTAHVRAQHQAERGDRLLGIPTYMSPEQCRGDDDVTASSDQYSLGVIAYEMLTGRPPFVGKSPLEIMRQHCEDEPRPLDQLAKQHPKFAKIVLKMLAKSPGDRYASLRLVAYELESALAEGGSPVEIAYSSYSRCCARAPFVDLFYNNLIEKPGVREAFRTVDMNRQADMLSQALKTLFTSGLESEAGRETASRIAKRHSRIDLSQLYDQFVDTLVATVREQDSQYTPQVEQAWKDVLGTFVQRLKAPV